MSELASLRAVSRTAIATAAVRARESTRSDALFDDPFAAAFVRASGFESAYGGTSPERGRELGFHVTIRTRFYDECLLDATASGIRQVVIVGAGLDTRAFRLRWPSDIAVVEVDLPDVPWLSAQGWITTEHELADLAASYGRPMHRDSRSGFVTALRPG